MPLTNKPTSAKPKKSLFYSVGEDNFFLENTAPFGETGTDPMSIPLGDRISCWTCYKVVFVEKCIKDTIIYDKVICEHL